MRLYYFTESKYGLMAIRDKRLKVSRIDSLNDTFEFLGLDLERDDRKKLKIWKKKINTQYGLICMSRRWSHPLLWAHYAEKHKGMCLGFEIIGGTTFNKVKYSKERPTIEDIGYGCFDDLKDSDLQKLIHKKFAAWRYESEECALVKLQKTKEDGDHHFLPFANNLRLVKVIFGQKSTVSADDLAKALGQHSEKVAVIKARAAHKTFKVVRNKLWPRPSKKKS